MIYLIIAAAIFWFGWRICVMAQEQKREAEEEVEREG